LNFKKGIVSAMQVSSEDWAKSLNLTEVIMFSNQSIWAEKLSENVLSHYSKLV